MHWFSFFDIGRIGEHLKCFTGYHIEQTRLLCRVPYSQEAQPASVGSLGLVGANLGLHTHCEAELWMRLEFGHHHLYLSGSLQRRLSVRFTITSRNVLGSILESWLDVKSD